jgi:phospholipid/cholesterol/gamma-HCH transport system substrate-binding protein
VTRNASAVGRVAAIAAIALAIVVVAIILLGGGSKSYKIYAIFQNASQVVPGDQVLVAGTPIGTVTDTEVTPDGQARLTLDLSGGSYEPLHQGTLATARASSLSGVANRYVDLRLGPASGAAIPNGGTIPTSNTTSAVDLDQLFDSLNAPTRKGLQNLIQGFATAYTGRGAQTQAAWQYLNPALASTSMLFREINRDTKRFTDFIVKTGNLFTDVAQRQSDLSGLVHNLGITTTALANQNVALGQAIQRLPGFMRLANTTFVNLRGALDELTPLVNDSKPVAPRLQVLLEQLKPLAHDAVPTVQDLSAIVSKPGPNNDLIDLTKLGVPLAAVTVKNVFVHGQTRPGAFPQSVMALSQSTPELAVSRPYAVDLTGWFEGYSHPGMQEVNGASNRSGLTINKFSLVNGQLIPLPPGPLNQLTDFLNGTRQGQGDRCPGSMERGAIFYPETGFPCTPSMVPNGP